MPVVLALMRLRGLAFLLETAWRLPLSSSRLPAFPQQIVPGQAWRLVWLLPLAVQSLAALPAAQTSARRHFAAARRQARCRFALDARADRTAIVHCGSPSEAIPHT